MGFVRRALQMAGKDLRLEWRTREKLSREQRRNVVDVAHPALAGSPCGIEVPTSYDVIRDFLPLRVPRESLGFEPIVLGHQVAGYAVRHELTPQQGGSPQ